MIFKITACFLVIFLIAFILLCFYHPAYYPYYFLPYRNITANPKKLNTSMMIGIPTIDRDIDIANKMYSELIISIQYLLNKYPNIKVDIVVITRDSDKKSIEFWHNKSKKVIIVPHYEIVERHNLNKLSEKFNKLTAHAKENKYDYLFFVESDVGLKKNTILNLFDLLDKCHVSTSCGIVPWAKKTVAYIPGFIPRQVEVKNFNKPFIGLGTGLMATMCKMDIFDNVYFNVDSYNEIDGQDVGFYKLLFKCRYKLIISNETINHYFDRKFLLT